MLPLGFTIDLRIPSHILPINQAVFRWGSRKTMLRDTAEPGNRIISRHRRDEEKWSEIVNFIDVVDAVYLWHWQK